MNEKYLRGYNNMKEIHGEHGEEILKSFDDSFKDIGKYIIEFVFSDLGNRKILGKNQIEIITITSLIITGNVSAELNTHIRSALKLGLTKEEIAEVFIQCIPHVGFPKVLSAVKIAQQIFREIS